MTADERLEALLNRAGQTISDLPKQQEYRFSYPAYLQSRVWDHMKSIYGDKWHELDYQRLFADYILHLTDVIDRVETALENVIGERDWLAAYYEDNELMPWYGVQEDWMVDE